MVLCTLQRKYGNLCVVDKLSIEACDLAVLQFISRGGSCSVHRDCLMTWVYSSLHTFLKTPCKNNDPKTGAIYKAIVHKDFETFYIKRHRWIFVICVSQCKKAVVTRQLNQGNLSTVQLRGKHLLANSIRSLEDPIIRGSNRFIGWRFAAESRCLDLLRRKTLRFKLTVSKAINTLR